MKTNFLLSRLVRLAVLAALVSACVAPTGTPSSPSSTTDAPKAQAGGTLTIGTVEEPETLNPHISQLVTSFNILSGVMDSLINFDMRQEMTPSLAESWKVSADGLTYTFNLRKNVQWHDGKPFSSADVKATFEMIMNPDFGAFNQLGWDKISTLETPDANTVVMTLKEPYAPFMSNVGTIFITPKHWIDKGVESFKAEYGRKPVGTGPFKVMKWETAQFVELAKNENYWGGAPMLDKIVYKIVPDSNTLLVQLKTGEVQLSEDVPAKLIEEAKALPNHTVVLLDGSEWTHMDLKFVDHLRDKRVRQALDFATPKDQIIEKILKGLGTVAIGDQSPSSPYINTEIKPRPYDLEAAAKLLADAGFIKNAEGILEKDGKPLAMEHWVPSGDEANKQVQQVIAASWRKLGIKVDTRNEDINSIWGPNGYQFNKTMTAGMYSWTNGNDPDNMFYWHSSQIPKDPQSSGGNTIAFFNKFDFQDKIDELTAAGTKETDPAKRKAIYAQTQTLLFDETPVIFMYWRKRIYIVPKNLSGMKQNTHNYLLWDVKDWALVK